MKLSQCLSIAAFMATAAAHGFPTAYTVDGKGYPAFDPFTDPYQDHAPKVDRKFGDDGPLYSKDDPALTCNKAYDGESFTTETVADANPGSTINIKWNRWPSDHKGPITTYAARCGDTREACNGFQAKDVVWFKIDEAGYDINAGTWATDTLIQGGDVWTFQLPNNIQQGAYLIRHEILALHSQGAPQWYPHCFAVYLSWGNGPLQGTPVSIPGTIYATPEDDQALFGSIYDTQAVQQMKIPGPALVQKRDIDLEDESESVQRRHAHTRKHLH